MCCMLRSSCARHCARPRLVLDVLDVLLACSGTWAWAPWASPWPPQRPPPTQPGLSTRSLQRALDEAQSRGEVQIQQEPPPLLSSPLLSSPLLSSRVVVGTNCDCGLKRGLDGTLQHRPTSFLGFSCLCILSIPPHSTDRSCLVSRRSSRCQVDTFFSHALTFFSSSR
jgi:hypothetical protein